MLRLKSKKDEKKSSLVGSILWVGSWIIQGCLWGALLFLSMDYWFQEVPSVNAYYESGLEQGFDGLAGVVASIDPTWAEVYPLTGHQHGKRYSIRQGEDSFNAWLELDEFPAWNAGLATVRFKASGELLWVRRATGTEGGATYTTDSKNAGSFPVIYPLRHRDNGHATHTGGGF